MSYSSGRGQTEPLAALVAVAAVGLGLSLYGGVLADALGEPPDREFAEPALDRVEHAVAPAGVVRPETLADGLSHAPAGHRIRLVVTSDGKRWTAGPLPDDDVRDRAERPVSVRVGPTDVRPGRLRAVVLG